MINVLDHGFVELEEHAGGDLSVVNAARVSYGKQVKEISEGDIKLIGFLMREKHGTPFEHNYLRFRVKAPIFVFREWHRHRVGISINEISGRYTELPEEWYIPKQENVRVRVGKPGHYTYEPAEANVALPFINRLKTQCIRSYEEYLYALEHNVAPELARLFLHVNHYSEMIWTCNARSLMNFLALRTAPTAQWEIQEYANALELHFARVMPVTHNAFFANDRIAP